MPDTLISTGSFSGRLGGGGFNAVTRERSQQRLVRVAEAAKLWADFLEGNQDPYLMRNAFQPTSEVAWKELCNQYPNLFQESMTISDFSSLTDNVIDKMLLDNYRAAEKTYPYVAKINPNVRDFRLGKMYAMDGMQNVLDSVAEKEGFNRRSGTQTSFDPPSLVKYEGGYGLSWEAVINDDIEIFRDFNKRLVQAAVNTVEKAVSQKYVGVNGPDGTLFTVGNGNIITGNPALGLVGLSTAFGQLMGFKDSEGLPLASLEMATLVVGTGAQYVAAMNLKNQLSVDMQDSGGDATHVIRVNNWLIQKFNVVFNPWIPILATNANGTTTWFLFANPNSATRPAILLNGLRGYFEPVLYRKAPNAIRVGGGADEQHGDFETMSTEYKVLEVFGVGQLAPKGAVASNGSGV